MEEQIDKQTGLPIDLLGRWGVGCEGQAIDREDGTRQHDLTLVRLLEEDETDGVMAATALLHRQVNSPYNRLDEKFTAFFSGIDEAHDALSRRDGRPPPLQERFAEVLTAFRVYLNRTPSVLAELHGAKSAVERAFKSACTAEYDRLFDYRLAYNLRNESDHRTDVVDVSFKARVTGPQSSEQLVTITINNDVLDHAMTDDRWQARVRKELATHPRPISGEELLRALHTSVQRILAKTILAQRASIEAAIVTVRAVAGEIECDGERVLMRYGRPDPDFPGARQKLQMQPVQTRAADTLEKALEDSEKLLWEAFVMPLGCAGPALDIPALEPALGTNRSVSVVAVRVRPEAGAFAVVRAPSPEVARDAVIQAGMTLWPPGSGLRVGPARPVGD
jgi:uncharacterized protein (DUF4415 family)